MTTDPDRRYENEDGRVRTFRQLAYAAWKEGKTVEPVEDVPEGIRFDGDLYTPVDRDDESD